MFHFNKKHLEDPDIPMWVIKARGESFYVEHVTCELPWSTKETPNNSHTKGSIKVKRCYLVIDQNNHAYLRELTPEIEARLSKPSWSVRVITRWGRELERALQYVEHSGVRMVGGACSTVFYITEFTDNEQYVMFKIALENAPDLRELKPNETYYQMYDSKADDQGYIDEDDWYDLYDKD